jgi:hypothetical protein
VQVPDLADALEQMKQQRRGDVVGKIAYDPQRPAALFREGAEVDPQRIRFAQAEPRLAAQLVAQQGGEVAVDLDRIERAAVGGEQSAGKCPAAGADLHQGFPAGGRDRGGDSLDHRRVV